MDDETMGTATTALDVVRQEILALTVSEDYKIASPEEAQHANEQLGKIKGLGKMMDVSKDLEIRPLNNQIKAIREKYREAEDLIQAAEATLKASLLEFRNAENRRLEQQRRIEQEAAAKERARLEEEARKIRERAEAEAAKLTAQGRDAKAEAVLSVAESRAQATESVAQMVAAPTKPAETTALTGMSVRETWKAKVTDMPTFLKSIAASPYDIEDVVQVKPAGLDRLAKTLKDKMEKVLPGCIAWKEESVAARAR